MARDGNWWSLDAAKINSLQQDSIVELVRRCKRAHFTNVQVRINGQWETYEADWIKHLMVRPRPMLTMWRSFTSALGRRHARLKAMMPWRRRSPDVFGADASPSIEMASNAKAAPVTPEARQ